MSWFSINYIAFEVLNYPLSYIELIGTLFGLISVWLATRANILTWPSGIVNEAAFFVLFFQVQLYADMFLQVFFFIVTIYGWWHWNKGKETDHFVKKAGLKERALYFAGLIIGTILLGLLMCRIHLIWPEWFTLPAAYPFPDAFTTTASICATFLLAQRKIESWILWILIDIVSIYLYLAKGIHFVAIEYMVFLVLATMGFWQWWKKMA